MDAETEQMIAVAQLVIEQIGGAQNAMTLYLTATSGYLLVAYLAGKELTRSQVVIISTLYATFASFATVAAVSFFRSALYFGNTYGAGMMQSWPSYSVGILFSLGILASLKFMRDIRHPVSE
ncbi:MAG: hypothetical protein ABJP82_19345 [Hyphomicrobiales bacterium]